MKIFIVLPLFIGLVFGQLVVPGNEKNPCDKEKDRHISTGGAPPGAFVPSCTANGWYSHLQTHGSTGYSWCVDPATGQEITGTKVGPGQTATCHKCLSDKAAALPAPRMVGSYAPQCDGHGHFQTKQIHPSTGYSWCVDRNTGIEVPGSRLGPGQQQPGRPCDQADTH